MESRLRASHGAVMSQLRQVLPDRHANIQRAWDERARREPQDSQPAALAAGGGADVQVQLHQELLARVNRTRYIREQQIYQANGAAVVAQLHQELPDIPGMLRRARERRELREQRNPDPPVRAGPVTRQLSRQQQALAMAALMAQRRQELPARIERMQRAEEDRERSRRENHAPVVAQLRQELPDIPGMLRRTRERRELWAQRNRNIPGRAGPVTRQLGRQQQATASLMAQLHQELPVRIEMMRRAREERSLRENRAAAVAELVQELRDMFGRMRGIRVPYV